MGTPDKIADVLREIRATPKGRHVKDVDEMVKHVREQNHVVPKHLAGVEATAHE